MQTNRIIEKAFRIIEDANPDGFRTFNEKKEIEDLELEVYGRVDNIYQGNDIHSRYIDMSFTIRILNHPTNGNLQGAFGGRIQERTEIYQN